MVLVSITHSGPANHRDVAARMIVVLGIALGLAGFAHVYTDPEPVVIQALEVLLVGIPALIIIYGGYWVASHRLLDENKWTVATWCLVGSVIGGVLVGGFLFGEMLVGNSIADGSLLFIVSMSSGALVGLVAAVATQQSVSTIEEQEDRDGRTEFESLSSSARTLATIAKDTYAWRTIQILLETDGLLTVESLASQLVTSEDVSEEAIYLELVHIQLPKLTDHGLVRYDAEKGVVRATDRLETVAAAGNELANLRNPAKE